MWFSWIDANVSLRMGIDVVASQQVVLFGTEQSLRRAYNSFDKAGVVLRVHGFSSLMAGTVCPSVVPTVAKSEAIGCEIHHSAGRSRSMAKNASAATG